MQDRYRLSNLIEKNLKDKKQYIYRIVDTNTQKIIATATSTKSKRQALTKAQDKLNKLNQELDQTQLRTLEDLITYFLENFKNTSKRQSTYRSREKQSHQLLEILGKNTALAEYNQNLYTTQKVLGHSTTRSIGATSYYIQIKQTQIKQLCQYMYDQLCKKPLQLLE